MKKEKIKIVHLITRLDKGGSSENVLLTVTHFAQKGYDCSLIYGKTTNPPVELIKKAETIGVKLICIDSLVRSISPFCDFCAFFALWRILRLLRPDIVHTHSSKAGILGRWAAWVCSLEFIIHNSEFRIKIVHTPHGHVFYGYYGKTVSAFFVLIEKITAIITDKIIALTEGEKKESLAYGVGKTEQWEVIHSGVDLSVSPLVRLSVGSLNSTNQLIHQLTNKLIIGSVGRLDPVKGYKYFVEAIPLILTHPLTRSSAHSLFFLIVGDGSERKNLEFIIHNSKLKDKVIFTGWRNDVEELINLMGIYVQPSINEGMGMTLLRAQALSKPIVATNVQGIPSVIKDSITGILVPPKNSQALAEAIIKLAKSKEQRVKMGEEGKKWATEIVDSYPRFSTQREIHLVEKLYAELLPK